MYNKIIGIENKELHNDKSKFLLPLSLEKIANELVIHNDTELIVKGTRNNTMFYMALKIFIVITNRKNIDSLKEFFDSINQKLCSPPLSDNEINNIWNSALKYHNQYKNRINVKGFVK